jgi:hypothetical protein
MKWCLLIRFESRWSPKSAARKEIVLENGLWIPIEIKACQHFDRVSLRCQSGREEVAVQRRKGVVKKRRDRLALRAHSRNLIKSTADIDQKPERGLRL